MSEIAVAAHPVRMIGLEQIIGPSDVFAKIGNVYDLINLGIYYANSSSMYRRCHRFDHKVR